MQVSRRETLRPLLLKLGSVALLTAMTALFKLVGDAVPPGQIIFARSSFALVPLMLWLGATGRLREAITINSPIGHLRRSGFGAISMAMFFTALPMVPLFDITILFFACPLTLIWLAAWVLKEPPTRTQLIATIIGFAGVLAAMWPQLVARLSATAQVSLPGTMLALGAAVATAFAMLSLRRIAQTETPASIIFVFLFTVSVLSLVLTGVTWIWPGWSVMLLLAAAGILGGIGQITMTYAYRSGPISLLSVMEYTAIIFAAVFGYLLFAEVPGWPALIGAALVSVAGMMVATAKPAPEPAPTP